MWLLQTNCAALEHECFGHARSIENCDKTHNLVDEFSRRCGAISVVDVLKPTPTPASSKGFFGNLWDGIKSTFSKMG